MARTAIVTGGGTGIGLATATLLAKEGYSVIAARLEREELPDGVSFVHTDVTDAAALKSLMDGPPDISALVNCAGVIRQQREWQTEDFSAVLNVNLTATLAASTAALPKLEKAGGAIVNIASMWAYFGSALSPGYPASKSGVIAPVASGLCFRRREGSGRAVGQQAAPAPRALPDQDRPRMAFMSATLVGG